MNLWTPDIDSKKVREAFIGYFGTNFSKEVDFANRVDVRSDIIVYNYKEDPYIWDQKKGRVPNYYTVYFDNVYICGFGEDQDYKKVEHEFWKGMRDAYKADKIRLNPGLAQEMRDKREAEIKSAEEETKRKIEKLPDSTPVQKMAKEAIKRVKNAKKNKPSANTS